MADLLRQFSGGRRVDEILLRIEDLVQRVRLTSDEDLMRESGMSTGEQLAFLSGMAEELQDLREDVAREQAHLRLREQWIRLKSVMESVPQAIESRGKELDRSYRLPGTLARATQDSREEGSNGASIDPPASLLDFQREPESGPQRGGTLIREHRNQANASPTASSSNTHSDSQTFDVVFIPFPVNYEIVERDGVSGRQKKTKLAIPDSKLKILQGELKKLGLVFQVTFAGDASDSVEKSFARKVTRFCVEREFHIRGSNEPNWVLMKRKGQDKFTEDVPTEEEFTVAYLKSLTRTSPKERTLIPNYLGTRHKILLIAPQSELLCGAIQVPGTTASQEGHRCHVSRALAAIENQKGRCNSHCPAMPQAPSQSSQVRAIRPHPMTTGRTLA